MRLGYFNQDVLNLIAQPAAYQLSVILKDGRKKDLLSNLDSPEIGFYMEHQIENWLDISDQPVRGELPD